MQNKALASTFPRKERDDGDSRIELNNNTRNSSHPIIWYEMHEHTFGISAIHWPTFPWKQIKHSIRFVLSPLLLFCPLTSHNHLVVLAFTFNLRHIPNWKAVWISTIFIRELWLDYHYNHNRPVIKKYYNHKHLVLLLILYRSDKTSYLNPIIVIKRELFTSFLSSILQCSLFPLKFTIYN